MRPKTVQPISKKSAKALVMPSAQRVSSSSGPQTRRWSAEEFYRLLDEGYFLGQRVELLEGEIIEMAAQKNWHALAIGLGDDELCKAFGSNYWVRVQMSLDLTPYSVLDPDLAVIAGTKRQNATAANPKSALLVVEVAVTTLRYDRLWKGSLYARVGIEDYWILNVKDRELEVYRRPVPDPKARFGYSYADMMCLDDKKSISPLAKPKGKIRVADMLP
jgi:Uma2 family endonuclease